MPLENLSSDPSQEYFADGITDALITDLSQITGLRVISRTSSMHYKKTSKTLPDIARELNVDAVAEASVVRSGDRVRITAQLLHAPTDKHLWAETYESDLGDVLKLQSEVAQAIARRVRANLNAQHDQGLQEAGRAQASDPLSLILGSDIGNQLSLLSGKRYVSAYEFALVHAGLGAQDEALDWLEKAYREHSAWMLHLKVDPRLDPLRTNPRFQQLVRRVGLG